MTDSGLQPTREPIPVRLSRTGGSCENANPERKETRIPGSDYEETMGEKGADMTGGFEVFLFRR